MTDAGAPSSYARAFLIADIRGYSTFTQARGDEAAALLASRFAQLTREGVDAFDGQVVEIRGDEALAVFDSARQALRAAVDLQSRYEAHSHDSPDLPLPVGIGVDAGEAVVTQDGYRGGALNVAARLCSIARPGEVLATEVVAHLARKIDGVNYSDRGHVQLRGIEQSIGVVVVAREGAELMVMEDLPSVQETAMAPWPPGAPQAPQPLQLRTPARLPFDELTNEFSARINERIQADLAAKLQALDARHQALDVQHQEMLAQMGLEIEAPERVRIGGAHPLPGRRRGSEGAEAAIAIVGMLVGLVIVLAIIIAVILIVRA